MMRLYGIKLNEDMETDKIQITPTLEIYLKGKLEGNFALMSVDDKILDVLNRMSSFARRLNYPEAEKLFPPVAVTGTTASSVPAETKEYIEPSFVEKAKNMQTGMQNICVGINEKVERLQRVADFFEGHI